MNQNYLQLPEETLLRTAFTTIGNYMYRKLNKNNTYQCCTPGIPKKIYKVLPEHTESNLQRKEVEAQQSLHLYFEDCSA